MKNSLEKIALDCRKTVLKMIHRAGTSHIGSNFSCTEILTVLYERILNVSAKLRPDRDRFILSAGWKAATLYYFLARKGIIPRRALATYCKPGSDYIGLAEPCVRGVEFAGGSMGMGLSAGVGMALAKKLKGEKGRVVVLESDGGMDCGMVWESLMIAAHHKLYNLTLIIDANGLQAMGPKAQVLNNEPLGDKLRSFGWNVEEINGHSVEEIERAIKYPVFGGIPNAIIARTVKGKGVLFMENDNLWHYWHVDKKIYQKALTDLCKK